MVIYVDTSALAKRYVAEQGSLAFEEFLGTRIDDEFVISPLGVTELESVLHRLLRDRCFDAAFWKQARADFSADVHGALWSVRPFEPSTFAAAGELIRNLGAPLATLDALHLASAHLFGCHQFATSDHQLARAAKRSGLAVHDFSA